MTTPCNQPQLVTGPFPQTLFMGCSIQDFTLNLGWGAEPSTCTVKILEDPTYHPSDANYNNFKSELSNRLSQSTINSTSTALDTTKDTIDGERNLHKNIYKKLQDTENARITNDVNGISDPNRQDNGKKIWKFGSTTAINHTKPDPGFLADKFYNATRDIDIMGSPVHFRFDNVIFNGIVKTWSYNNGSVEVQLQSPTNLIKGTKLILKDYLGTISTTMYQGLAVPYDNGTIDNNGSVENIYAGNIPNILNVFGEAGMIDLAYTEDRGVSLGRVYDYVKTMLSVNAVKNQFNPYGAIVGKAARSRKNGAYLTNSTTVGGTDPALTADQYNIIGGVLAADNIYRPLFSVDLSDVPRPPNQVYINETSISLLDFIDKCCEPVGYDFWFELVPTSDAGRSATIKVHTISRRYQPSINVIRDLMQNWDQSNYVIDYKFGQEFQDTKTRSIIAGGNQQRLVQIGNYNLGQYRHRRVYEPSEQSFVNFQFNTDKNFGRLPDSSRYRNTGSTLIQQGGAVTAQHTNNFYVVDQDPFSALNHYRGSYQPREVAERTDPNLVPVNYGVSSQDYIKPYFGKHGNGTHRVVSFHQDHGELKIQINTDDLANLFPAGNAASGGSIDVGETEIRCAMASMDSWLNYIFEMPGLGKTPDISTYIYNYISAQQGASFASNFFLNAMGIFSGQKGKLQTLPAIHTYDTSINLENYYPYSEFLWPVLSALHAFFKDLGDTYYGQQFMVRLPNISSYVDSNGVRVYSYEVTDKAWEEPNNYIDDTVIIGGDVANGLANEDGTFSALVAYDATAEYDAYFSTNINDSLTRIQSPAMVQAKFFSRKNPTNWYYPLVHDIPFTDVYYLPWIQETSSDLEEGMPIINPAFPALDSAHGLTPPNEKRWKMYTKANIEEIEPYAQTNTKLTFLYDAPHAVIKTPKVMIDTPTHLIKHMCEEYFIHNGLPAPSDREEQGKALGMMLAWSIAEKGLSINGVSLAPPIGNQNNMRLAPRAAAPIFAAIPVKSNVNCYGPWVSHPGKGYEADNNLFNDPSPISQINNLVGEVNFTRDEQAVPWNYGGVNAMDTAILTQLKDSNYYQQVLENGTVTTAGVLFINAKLGGVLQQNGPILNSINVNIGNDGFTTTYTMRTYTKKRGFYNKEDAENIQRVNRQFIENRQKSIKTVKAIAKERNDKVSSYLSTAKGMSTSPMGILVGAARPFLYKSSSITESNLFDTLKFNPYWAYHPYMGNFSVSPTNHMIQKANIVLYDEQEMSTMMVEEYNRKSFMSLDGIFSPISFYPTAYASTYAQTKYDRSKCPYCKGQGTYTYIQLKPSLVGEATSDEIAGARTLVSANCGFCVPDTVAAKYKNKSKSARPSLMMPPYIAITGSDADALDENGNVNSDNIDSDFSSIQINKFTLNPIVMTQGEFALTGVKKAGDKCGHSIDVVAFDEEPPIEGNSMRATSSNSPSNNYAANVNQRFMGLRGPVMVHGWGYDTDGFPVPNGSGELELKDDGKWRSITSQILSDGTWSEPYKMTTFLKGWAQQPASWPVGPVDLRWDAEAGVWTVGANYKNVWVTIEVDLVGTEPARGIITGDDSSSLPEGARKLVFVKDEAGIYSAPRNADIYCTYNPDNGFYSPLYNRPLMTSGEILSGATATIYQSYSKDYDESDPTTYDTAFKDPLSFNPDIGKLGLFVYINGSWILQGAN